jgi:hypothetical protein
MSLHPWRAWLAVPIGLALVACASLPRDPVPPQFVDDAAVLEGAEVRFWGDRAPPNINALAAEKWAQVRATRPYLLKQGRRPTIRRRFWRRTPGRLERKRQASGI